MYELDPATGIVLRSADYSGFSFDALAYGQDALYALDYNLSIIYQLDLDAATATEVGSGFGWVGGLTFGGSRGTLFVNAQGQILEIDPATGTTINAFPAGPNSAFAYGLGYSDALGTLFLNEGGTVRALDPDSGDQLYAFALNAFYSGLAADESASVSWLSAAPESGTIPAGATATISVTVDAAALVAGQYQADVVVNADGAEVASVAVTADVSGTPVAVVAPGTLAFEPIIAGAESALPLVVDNVGTDTLALAFASSSPAFLAPEPVRLAPGQRATVSVVFAPAQAGAASGTLIVTTNDPTQPSILVALSGTALEAPVLTLSPGSFALELDAGDTAQRLLTAQNDGGSPLELDLQVRYPDATNTLRLPAPRTPFHVSERGETLRSPDADRSASPNATANAKATRSDFASSRPNAPRVLYTYDYEDFGPVGLPVLEQLDVELTAIAFDPFLFYNELQGGGPWDLVVIESTFIEYGDANNAPIRDYVDAGGQLLMWYQDVELAPALAQALDAEWLDDLQTALPVYAWRSHPTFSQPNDVDDLLVAPTSFTDHGDLLAATAGGLALGGYAEEVTDGQAALVLGNDGRTLLAGVYPEGLLGLDADADGRDDARELFENHVSFLLGAVRWLAVSPSDATLAPGGQAGFNLVADAGALVEGVYEADVVVTSNDPVRPEVIVPVTLTVDGDAAISVAPGALDFGLVYAGTDSTLTLVLANPGTAALTVSAIASSDDALVVSPAAPLTLAPGDEQTLGVTYSPDTPGTLAATLTLQSDADSGDLVIPVSGLSVLPPVLSLSPDSLSTTLFVGETDTLQVTLANTGGSPLTFAFGAAVEGPFFVPEWGGALGWNFELRAVTPDPSSQTQSDDHADFHVDGDSGLHPWGTGALLLPGAAFDGSPVPSSNYSEFVTVQPGDVAAVRTRDGRYAKIQIESLGQNGGFTFSQIFPVEAEGGARRAPSWVTIEPSEGEIAPGDSVVVDVIVDAEDLAAGSYVDAIELQTNAPGQEALSIPIAVKVVGVPELTIQPDEVDLGTLFLGTPSAFQSLVLTNTGTAPLSVLSALASSPEITVSGAPFLLEPGATDSLSVSVLLTEAGPFAGTVTITTDIGDVTVPVTAVGAEAPALVVTPTSLEAATVAGTAASATLTLSNPGGSPLAFEIAVLAAEGLLASTTPGQPFATPGAEWAGAARASETGVSPDVNRSRTPLPTVIEDPAGDSSGPDAVALRAALQSDVLMIEIELADPVSASNLGGFVYLDLDRNAATGEIPGFGLDSWQIGAEAIASLFDLSTGEVFVVIGDDVFVVSAFVDGTTFGFSIPADLLVGNDGDGIHVAAVIGDGAGPTDYFPEADFGVIGGAGPTWLTVAPAAGTVEAGDAAELSVTLDAAELPAGTYEAVLSVSSNVPGQAAVAVPVTFVVAINPAVEESLPTRFSLGRPYPNPSVAGATLDYALPASAEVRLELFDVQGKRVAVLDAATRPAGRYTVRTPDGLAPGVYVARLLAGSWSQTQRIVLAR